MQRGEWWCCDVAGEVRWLLLVAVEMKIDRWCQVCPQLNSPSLLPLILLLLLLLLLLLHLLLFLWVLGMADGCEGDGGWRLGGLREVWGFGCLGFRFREGFW